MIDILINMKEIMDTLGYSFNTLEQKQYNEQSTIIYIEHKGFIYMYSLEYRRTKYNLFTALKVEQIGVVSDTKQCAKLYDYLVNNYDSVSVPKSMQFDFSVAENGMLRILSKNIL